MNPMNLFYKRLLIEIDEWKKEKLIDDDQYDTLSKRYSSKIKSGPGILSVLAILGAILIGAGFLILIAANWDMIPKMVRFVGVIIFLSSFYLSGYYLAYHKKTKVNIGNALIIIGSILFGGGIFLTAQIFHIQSRYFTGLLVWALGIIPIAYVIKSRVVMTFSIFLLNIWSLMKLNDFNTLNWQLPVVLILAYFPFAYYKRSRLVYLASIFSSVYWINSCLVEQFASRSHYVPFIPINITIALTLLLFSYIEKEKKFNKLLNICSNLFLMFLIYILTFKHGLSEVIRDINSSQVSSNIYFIPIVFTVISIVIFKFVYKRFSKDQLLRTVPVFFIFPILYYIGISSPQKGSYIYSLFILISNIYMLVFSILTVREGTKNHVQALVNIGFIFFALQFFARYFDYAWKYLARGGYFIITGAVLMGASWFLEKRRRKMIDDMEADND